MRASSVLRALEHTKNLKSSVCDKIGIGCRFFLVFYLNLVKRLSKIISYGIQKTFGCAAENDNLLCTFG